MAARTFHQGEWLRRSIAMQGGSVAAFARRARVSRDALNKWFTQDPVQWRLDSEVRVLRELGYDVEKLIEPAHLSYALDRDNAPAGAPSDALVVGDAQKTMIARAMSRITGPAAKVQTPPQPPIAVAEEPDQNVEIIGPVIEIPLFDLSLAAGPWQDVADVPEVADPSQIMQGLFRVRLNGDSMLPRYRGGEIVEFRVLRPGEDVMRPGKDYYVQRSDGTATFKRLQRAGAEQLVLRALNVEKYKKHFLVDVADVVRMARAVAKVELLE